MRQMLALAHFVSLYLSDVDFSQYAAARRDPLGLKVFGLAAQPA